MKAGNISKGLLLGLTLLLATSLFAAGDTNKGSLETLSAVSVNGTNLPAGDYSVKWEGTGSNVQMSILKGKKVVVTAPARIVELSTPPAMDSAVVTSDNGTRTLSEVRFGGKKYALQIGQESGSSASASGSSK
ncbi:MAG: hypothetical protein WB952_24235 [Terriglobales bacterium]